MSDVALVAMPFGPLMYPSIGLSLLQPAVERRGFSCKAFYFLIDYAERVGLRFYDGIAQSRVPPLGKLPGEWIFRGQLFDSTPEEIDRYVNAVLRTRLTGVHRAMKPVPEWVIEKMVREHRDAGAFLDRCLEAVLAENPRVVGFTSTFQQHVASLALAKRIKAARPDVFVVMGGANCEHTMGAETVRQFPFVDALVSGEGDLTFPEIVRRVIAGEPVDGMQGVRTPATIHDDFAKNKIDNTPPVLDLDALPENDYDDYLRRFRKSRFFRGWQPRLLFETSRGCWWGERMHCTFCGLNGNTMKYRSKSPQKALGEMRRFTERYPGYDVDVTDNIIDLGYFDSVLPELARYQIKGMELFYETKSNLRKHQVKLFRDAHILRIQPGIESLSDVVLKLMRKGVTALHNIQLLKWAREYGVRVQWNLLCGFPGEPPSEYEKMSRLFPLLEHLEPAEYFIPIRMDRFSPNFFDAEKMGLTDVRPFEAYYHVYRLPDEAVRNLACFFRFNYAQPQDVNGYALPTRAAFYKWRRNHAGSALFSIDTADHLIIWDLRGVAKQLLTVLSDLQRKLYLACDAISYGRQLAATFGISEEQLAAALDPLIDLGLMLHEGDRYLSLAIPLGEYSPSADIVHRFESVVRSVGDASKAGIAVPWNTKATITAESRRKRAPKARRLIPSRFAVDSGRVVLR